MGIPQEYERHKVAADKAGNTVGVLFWERQRRDFQEAVASGVIPENAHYVYNKSKRIQRGRDGVSIGTPHEMGYSIEQGENRITFQVSIDPKEYEKRPQCESCGSNYKKLIRYARIIPEQTGIVFQFASLEPSGYIYMDNQYTFLKNYLRK